jgi:hypothetical protein
VALIGLGVAIVAVGCSKPSAHNPLAPTAVMPMDLASHAAGTNRHFKASVAPASVGAGSAPSLSITITNCSDAACPGNPTSANQNIGSAEIVVPAGFAATSVTMVNASGGKSWSAALVAGTIRLGANGGTQRLAAGESVTVTFDATAPAVCDFYTWETRAYQDTLSGGQLVTTTPYALVGSQPQVEVTGCASGCTLSQGYWKTHPQAWPVASLTLGTVVYTAEQLLSILQQQVAGNGLVQLAHQLIAAKLNIANGADGTAVASTIAAADTLIGSLVVPPVGSGSLATSATSALNDVLDNYNTGVIGPGACQP